MADALIGVTESQAAAMDIISNQVQSYLNQESKMLPLVSNYSALAKKGSKTVEIPRAGGFAAVDDKVENTSVDSQILTFATDSLGLTSHKVIQWLVEDIAEEQAVVYIVQEALKRAGSQIARTIDQALIDALEGASASTPDHRIAYAGTTVIAEADILDARQLLQAQFLDPKECYLGINSLQEKEMLGIANFIDASKYGSNEALVNGEIGRVFGVKVIVHEDFESLKSIMWHPSSMAFASQMGPNFKSESDLKNLGTRYSVDHLFGVKMLDSGKRNVMIGTAT